MQTAPGVANVDHDTPEQLERITQLLLAGEHLAGVYDLAGSGAGSIGITDRRLMLTETGRVTKKRAVTSYPWRHIVSVAVETTGDGRFTTGNLTCLTSAQTELAVAFTSAERARTVAEQIIARITST